MYDTDSSLATEVCESKVRTFPHDVRPRSMSRSYKSVPHGSVTAHVADMRGLAGSLAINLKRKCLLGSLALFSLFFGVASCVFH